MSSAIVIIMTFLLLILITGIKNRFFSKDKSKVSEFVPHPKISENQIDDTPDKPMGFGYKSMWIAVKNGNNEKISNLLGLKKSQIANWQTGIHNAYLNSVFITPMIDNWKLAVGMKLPTGDSEESIEKVKTLLKNLSNEFGEAQFFCTHRVVEYHCWIKSTNGVIDRVYSYLGERGENIMIEGIPTEIEKQYNLINTLSPESKIDGYYDRDDLEYPDEELVMKIAENWSINPITLDDRNDVDGLGLLIK